MAQIDIIQYLEGLTAFVFDKAVLTRIAVERDVMDVTDSKQLTQQYSTPTNTKTAFVIIITEKNQRP